MCSFRPWFSNFFQFPSFILPWGGGKEVGKNMYRCRINMIKYFVVLISCNIQSEKYYGMIMHVQNALNIRKIFWKCNYFFPLVGPFHKHPLYTPVSVFRWGLNFHQNMPKSTGISRWPNIPSGISCWPKFHSGISRWSNFLPGCVSVIKLLKMAKKIGENFKKWPGIVLIFNKMLKISENCYILPNIGKSSQTIAEIVWNWSNSRQNVKKC